MKFSYLMVANAVFATIGALILIFAPAQTMQPYGVNLEAGGIFLGQLMGAILIGFASVYYLLRNTRDKEVIRAVSIAALIAHGLSAVFGILAVTSNTLNSMVWVDVILHALFALAFWKYGLKRK